MNKPNWIDAIILLMLVAVFVEIPWDGGEAFPLTDEGLHVLIVEETEGRAVDVATIITSVKLRRFLQEHEADYRIWDKDTDITRDDAKWAKAMELERDGLPWLIVWNGSRGVSGPLPKTVDEVIEVVGRYK